MKHTIAGKFLLFFLTALALLTAVAGAGGIALLESNGLYATSLDDQRDDWYDKAGNYIAWEYASRYAAKHLGQCSETLVDWLYDEDYYGVESDHWQIELYQDGIRLAQTYQLVNNPIYREYTFSVDYPVATRKPAFQEDAPETDEPESNLPEEPPLYTSRFTIWENGEGVEYYLNYYESPTYTIQIKMDPDVTRGTPGATLSNMYPYRFAFIGILVLGLFFFAFGLVFLLRTAGVDRDGSIRLAGLNLAPLDLYAGSVAGSIMLLIWVFNQLSNWSQHDGYSPAILTVLGLSTLIVVLLLLGFLYALTAQAKLKNGFWWKHSCIGFCLQKLALGVKFCLRGLRAVYQMLPVLWRWLTLSLLAAATLSLSAILALSPAQPARTIFLTILLCAVGFFVCIALYCGYCFAKLLMAAEKLAAGDFEYKISSKHMYSGFHAFASALNALSDTAMQTARQQLKSERMKTELITNISHDIKTPLTSIINFVDLLQKPHSSEEQAQYLEILSRQSGRMKKLIEDLIDLSKASTGNITVNITQIDAVEALNQALGEFADRLDAVPLEPVFHQPDHPVMILADGRQTWRVLSNLLSNAVKYAMPNTRLHIDLMQSDKHVTISLKNVSRAALSIDPEELLERFVQGDISRNTEGSGLGLNIARSLMEVQHGTLHLAIDGDLFKVTLQFPIP